MKKKFIKFFYPLIVKFTKKNKKLGIKLQNKNASNISIFQQNNILDNEKIIEKNKITVVVNIASECGFTPQLNSLQKIYANGIRVIGIPSNDFKNQEPLNDQQIEKFCQLNFGVTFPIVKKQSVINPLPNSLMEWLTEPRLNGWNSTKPVWNFTKFVVNKQGELTHVFGPSVEIDDEDFKQAIKK